VITELEEIRFVIYFRQLHSFNAVPHSYGTHNSIVLTISVTGQHPEQLQFVLARVRARARTQAHKHSAVYFIIKFSFVARP